MSEERPLPDVAHERAERYAPMPRLDAIQSGLAGAVVAGLSALLALTFAGLRVNDEEVAWAAAVTGMIGFLVPYLYLKNQERLHWRAWSNEYEALRRQDGSSD